MLWWDPYRHVALVRLGDKTAVLHWDAALALLDGQRLLDLPSLRMEGDVPVISQGDWQILLHNLDSNSGSPVDDPQTFRIGAVVVDAGHGGRDPGAVAVHQIGGQEKKVQEKDITLHIALELERLLKSGLPDRRILMTRRDDSYPTLERRVEMANAVPLQSREAVIFLSVHANASLNTAASGPEVWFIPQNYQRDVLKDEEIPSKVQPVINALRNYEYKTESRRLSEFILSAVEKELGLLHRERGLKENPWFVVRMAKMPAVLVEVGFVTNKKEAENLADPQYLNKLALGIYTGLVQFINQYEGTETNP